jgi:hypothetical protein
MAEQMDSFHASDELAVPALEALVAMNSVRTRTLGYYFLPHFHPYASELVDELIEDSIAGLEAADTRYQTKPDGSWVMLPGGGPRPVHYRELFTEADYAPTKLVRKPYPVADLDFGSGGAYSVYNWELFYHLPLTVAMHLSKNQRFEEAQRWLHHIFDPTDDGPGPTPERFWKVRPFHTTHVQQIEKILVNLSTNADEKLKAETVESIQRWRDAPFRPHAVARYRPSAYMFKAVMAYLDNLIAWGDALFRQDTGESINEATQVYVLAANILGRRPQAVPRKGWQRPQTYSSLRADLDEFGNALREVEADIPFDLGPAPAPASGDGPLASLASMGDALYFCVPRNDKLIGYWDTVADRLFKIHNSLNIQGVFRQLPLFEPPIDPALLAKAVAAGVDIGAVISGQNQPMPLVRFPVLIAKAAELCQEVQSLAANLLSAMEKEDGEALQAMRARHERTVLALAETVRYQQWQEAIKAREGVERTLANAVGRYVYYERLLGRSEADITVPTLSELDTEALARMRLQAKEPELGLRPIPVDIVGNADAGGHPLSANESDELDKLGHAQDQRDRAAGVEALAAALSMIPMGSVDGKPLGVGTGIQIGGLNLAEAMSAGAAVLRALGDRADYQATLAGKVASFGRREQEWAHASNVAAGEITTTFKHLRAAQIREAMSEREWRNHQQQIRNAEEVERFLTDERTGKTTRTALYAWLRREVRGLYGQCFQLAFDVARKAERALQHELGDPGLSYLQFGYQSGREGLLAGERLYLDVRRMELAYQELNRREYELTRHVSLRQVDPTALLALRATGSCTVRLPEELFDLDCPGHYFRRLRTVALSLPCVVGPYASVNCTLTLLRSSIRTTPSLGEDGYPRSASGDDPRFSDHFGGIQSIVTSSATNDPGLFEPVGRDERYLPFEGSGAISEWRLELPADVPQFDRSTISDAILHLRYTAREGGVPLRNAAVANLSDRVAAAAATGSDRLLSIRHEFPTEWARFTSTTLGATTPLAPLKITLREEHYPFWASTFAPLALTSAVLYAQPGPTTGTTVTVYDKEVDDPPGSRHESGLVKDPSMGALRVGALPGPLPPAVGDLTLYLDDTTLVDLWLVLTWGTGSP